MSGFMQCCWHYVLRISLCCTQFAQMSFKTTHVLCITGLFLVIYHSKSCSLCQCLVSNSISRREHRKIISITLLYYYLIFLYTINWLNIWNPWTVHGLFCPAHFIYIFHFQMCPTLAVISRDSCDKIDKKWEIIPYKSCCHILIYWYLHLSREI